MTAHLRYLRYVLLHKWYVYRAGRVLGVGRWRLLIHDLSKFRPSEWRPYARHFYGRDPSSDTDPPFSRAWLLHLHRNAHHWQHWILHRDDGRVIVELMPPELVDEMVADWIGAGTKILARPTLLYCVAETLKWYRDNAAKMQLRTPVRARVEARLVELAERYGIVTPRELSPIASITIAAR